MHQPWPDLQDDIAALMLGLVGISFGVSVQHLVAADLNLSQKPFTVVVVGVGLVHGLLNGVALKEGAGILGLIGIMATLFVIVAIVSAFIVYLKQPWTRILVRVAGSWVAAIGMLMFGWIFRGTG